MPTIKLSEKSFERLNKLMEKELRHRLKTKPKETFQLIIQKRGLTYSEMVDSLMDQYKKPK